MAILDLQAEIWRRALNLPVGQEPDVLILEGTWWREKATERRLSHLTEVTETAFPDIFIGRFAAARVAYCCAYGAARAVEPAHIFAQMGTPLVIQIGTCGALVPGLSAGTVTIPARVVARDGVSLHYDASHVLEMDVAWGDLARQRLAAMGIRIADGLHLTWPSLFAQSDAMCATWTREGIATVDMETSAVAAVAQRFGAAAVALLSVWDALPEGKTFLDPLDPAATASLERSNDAVFTVALHLAEEVASRRAA
jgi:purine-nucleoside phosphorylase